MKKQLNIQFDKAVRLLAEGTTASDESSRKPLLPHDIRVGVYLYNRGYEDEVVIAGVLHDALEFSTISEQEIQSMFGERVLALVKANTKDDSIEDKQEKTNELIKRCVDCGQDALIIKAADIMDSYAFYTEEQNVDQLEYCRRNAGAIFEYKPNSFDDPVFEELRDWMK